jgi:hypothetical protein
MQDRHQPTYQQSCPAPQGAIALAVVLLVTGTSLLIYGAKHLAGHIIRTDGAVSILLVLKHSTYSIIMNGSSDEFCFHIG